MEGKLEANGSTPWIESSGDNVYVAAEGTYGGGTIAIETRINNSVYPARDDETAITKLVPFSGNLIISNSPQLRLTLSGATSPVIDWVISSAKSAVATNQ